MMVSHLDLLNLYCFLVFCLASIQSQTNHLLFKFTTSICLSFPFGFSRQNFSEVEAVLFPVRYLLSLSPCGHLRTHKYLLCNTKKQGWRDGSAVRIVTALPENLNSVPSTHMSAHNLSVIPVPRGPMASIRHASSKRHICRQNTYIHRQK